MDGQTIKDTLGKNIKIFRARRGLSQADLAEKADISIPFLSNIERGIKYPQPDMLAKIADSLGVKVNELFIVNQSAVESSDILSNLAEDMTKDVNRAMTKIFKQYST
jgi:transcriptional regulator with XRE-family HTH domain